MVPRAYSKWGKIYCRKSKITKKSKSVSCLNSDLLPLPPARMMEAPLAVGGGGRHMWPRSQGPSPKTPSPEIWFDLEEEAAGISQPAAHPQLQSPEVFLEAWSGGLGFPPHPGCWRLGPGWRVENTDPCTPHPRGWWEELHAGGAGHSQKPRGVHPHPGPHWSPWRRGPLSPPQLRCCDTEVLMASVSPSEQRAPRSAAGG